MGHMNGCVDSSFATWTVGGNTLEELQWTVGGNTPEELQWSGELYLAT